MIPRPSPRLKSHTPAPNGRTAADRSAPADQIGRPKSAAEGVVPSSDPQTGDGRHPIAGLNVVCPPDFRTVPTATSWCACGRMRRAVGRRQVIELAADHAAHCETCPHHPNPQPQPARNGRRVA